MSAPPTTRLDVTAQEAATICAAVRSANLSLLSPMHRIAGPEHIAGLIILLNLVADILYAWIDPRIKFN